MRAGEKNNQILSHWQKRAVDLTFGAGIDMITEGGGLHKQDIDIHNLENFCNIHENKIPFKTFFQLLQSTPPSE